MKSFFSFARSHRDGLVALALFTGAFAVLFGTQASVGFVRDESVYFAAAESYARWFQLLFRDPSSALTDGAIVRAFDFNHEHPALMKMLFGLSYLFFHEGLGLLKPAAAFRVPAFAVAALIPALIYLLSASLYDRRVGIWGAISFLLVPRQFFNSHLACFDVPIAAMWLLTVYLFWRAQEKSRGWLWCGLAFGLALATKHNGWFLPWVLAPFALWRGWWLTRSSPAARAAFFQIVALFAGVGALFLVLFASLGPQRFVEKIAPLSPATALALVLIAGSVWLLRRLAQASEPAFRALSPLVAMALIGPAIFYLHWPYLWHHPIDRAAWYFEFHATHNHYAWFYLGKVLRAPPFPLEYVLVKTALTVPSTLFLPMALGLGALALRGALSLGPKLRSRTERPRFGEVLTAVNAIVPILIISHPDVPHFGGVKHWLAAMPFLAVLGGRSVCRAADFLSAMLRARWPALPGWATAGPLMALTFAPALIATARIHPYGTSYYSELAGGLPGAATLGMQRQFWSNNVTGVLPWINDNAPPGARLWLHEVNGFSFRDYQRNGMLRRDLQPAGGPEDAQVAAYQYHQEFREHEMNIWQAFGTRTPVTGLYLDETPQVIVYRRR